MKIYLAKAHESLLSSCEKVLCQLSDEKRNRMKRFRFKMDYLRSLLGEWLLRYGLDDLGVREKKIHYTYGLHKKPYLQNLPYYFNISHSGEYIVCCLGKEELGVDIQEKTLTEESQILSLAESFFTPQEYEEMILQEDRIDYFFTLWTLKESYLKFGGKGLYEPLDSIEFHVTRDRVIYQGLDEIDLFFYTQLYEKQYRLSLCTKGDCHKVKVIKVTREQLLNYATKM